MRIKKKRGMLRLKLFAAAAVLTAMAFSLDARIRPMLETYAVNQASNRVTQIVNEAVNAELAADNIGYNQLISLSYTQEGTVTSLQTNMIELNRLQSSITRRIITSVMQFDSQTIKISAGALIGGPIFSGRGPDITVRLIPANFIETRIVNRFEDSGINQTRHQVVMEIKLIVTAVMPGYQSSTTVNTNVVLAETVIVGQVPDAYTKVYGGTDPLVGMLQDYGAESS